METKVNLVLIVKILNRKTLIIRFSKVFMSTNKLKQRMIFDASRFLNIMTIMV